MPKIEKSIIQDITSMTPANVKKAYKELSAIYTKTIEGAYCHQCAKFKPKTAFYLDCHNASGVTSVCKECAFKTATQYDEHTKDMNVTRDSIMRALRSINKPFLDVLYESSIGEVNNEASGKAKSNIWTSYIKNVCSLKQYNGMDWTDSDSIYNLGSNSGHEKKSSVNEVDITKSEIGLEIMNQYEQNRKDSIKLLGYDPFLKESPEDQPFLYSTLIGYLDISEDSNDDRMRLSSIIEIVKGFNHIEKLNDIISSLINDYKNVEKNISTVKTLEETKTKITTSMLGLAKDNGISLKHSVNASKGENTWTGKIKKLKEMKLREAEVNGFDIGTCRGMQQVADISHASIIKQIKLDENDYTTMLIEQRELIRNYRDIAEIYQEKTRLLLRENIDLKSYMKSLNISLEEYSTIDTILFEEDVVDVEYENEVI